MISEKISGKQTWDDSKCTKARLEGFGGGGGSSTKLYFYLVNLSNRIVDTGKYPALWSFCLIVPIHKNDDRSKVENYRGITLLSALGKPFTSILLYKGRFRPEVQPLTLL